MRIFSKEETRKVMKFVKKILFMFALVAGLSVVSMAQKGDQKPPPKEHPPVINPREKPPPRETPRPDKPKKPGMEALVRRENGETLA
jgi:hypothetical protein